MAIPSNPSVRAFFARFPDGTSLRRSHASKVFTHAYLVLFERPDGTHGFQRSFCQSWKESRAKVEAEKQWLRENHHALVEAFIVKAGELKRAVRRKPLR